MILVDTSVWINHLKKGNALLSQLLSDAEVICHPFIVGELACGNLRNRVEILSLLDELPAADIAQHGEVLTLIDSRRLMGKGLGWIDAHLLASALLSNSILWTLDKSLINAANILGLNFGRK